MKENKEYSFKSFIFACCFVFVLHAAYIEIHTFKSLFTLIFAIITVVSYACLLYEYFKKGK